MKYDERRCWFRCHLASFILPYILLDLLHHHIIKLDSQIEFLALGASLGGATDVLIRCQCGECAIRLVISIASCIEMVDLKIYDKKTIILLKII